MRVIAILHNDRLPTAHPVVDSKITAYHDHRPNHLALLYSPPNQNGFIKTVFNGKVCDEDARPILDFASAVTLDCRSSFLLAPACVAGCSGSRPVPGG